MRKIGNSERNAAKIGAREKILNSIQSKSNETLGLKSLDNEQTYSKLRVIFGKDTTNKIQNYVKDELKAMRNVNKISQGSQTSEKQTLKVPNKAEIIGKITGFLNKRISEPKNQAIAKMFTDNRAELLKNNLNLLNNKNIEDQYLRYLQSAISSELPNSIINAE